MGPGELSPRWRGVHHLALVTPDMDATVRFWHGVLGARLVATIGTPTRSGTTSSSSAPGNTIAFFEYRGAELDVFAKPAGRARPAGVAVRPPVARPARRGRAARAAGPAEGARAARSPTSSTTASCARSTSPTRTASPSRRRGGSIDATGRPTDYGDEPLFADPDPVPAVAELRARGEVDSIPATQLVDEITRDIYRAGP